MDPAASATYRTTFGDVVYPGKIEDWPQSEGVPDVDVVVGGPPCPGFSALGKQDVVDARNTMWNHYAETVRLAQPSFFVLENVPQFLSSPQFDLFGAATAAAGALADYTFTPYLLNAANCGAAQLRKGQGYTARSRGRSAMSLRRLPSIIMSSSSLVSSPPLSRTAASSSGRAKW